MILTTTNTIEGKTITAYKGIVTGVAINDKKLAMGFSVSKYYKAIQDSIEEVKENAFQSLLKNAERMQANAIVGITVDIEMTTSNYAMVSVIGTAVVVD